MDAENTKELNEPAVPGSKSISDADLAAASVALKLSDESWHLNNPPRTFNDNSAPSKALLPPIEDSHSFIQDLEKKRAIPFYSSQSSEIGFRFGGHNSDIHADNNLSNRVRQSHPAGLYFKVNF